MVKTINDWLFIQDALEACVEGVRTDDGKDRIMAISGELDVVVSFYFADMQNKINQELKVFRTKQEELFRKYGEEVPDNPDTIMIPKDKTEQFNKELQPLLEIEKEIEIDLIPASSMRGLSWTTEGRRFAKVLSTCVDLKN